MNPDFCEVCFGVVRRQSAAFVLCLLWLLLFPLMVRAQLVADGQTNFLDNVATNVTGGLIVGNSGSFTLLVITNGATVTNVSGTSAIGNGAAANTNHVVVTGAGSILNNIGTISIGAAGSANELDVLNGGLFTDTAGSIGQSSPSSNNVVLVSGSGSVWTNSSSLTVGNNGWNNVLIVTNGGKVFSAGNSAVGTGPNGTGNLVVITGAGSSWNCGGYFYLSYIDRGRHQFLVNNGGDFNCSSWLDIGVYSSTNNLTVADTNSTVQCQFYRMGYSSSANQCVVSNGATLTVLSSIQATVIEGTFTTATVTGAGSVWTNAGDLDFGQFSNTLAITSGGRLVDVNGYIENGSGKPNTVIVAGANSLWRNLSELHIADPGAQLIITNGGAVGDINGYLGDNAGNNNCYALVSGPGSVWTNGYNLFVGNSGVSNQLVVANSGRVSAAMNLFAQYNAGMLVTGSGTLNASFMFIGANGLHSQMVVSNGGTAYAGSFTIGNGQSNTVTLAGGAVFVTNGVSLANHATLILNSGQFKANSLSVSSGTQTNKVIFNGGTLQSGSTSYGTVLPFLVGDGTDAATFQMLNNGTHTFPAGLLISSNATLDGAGTVDGDVTINNGGTIAPGTNNLANIVVNGNLTLNAGATNFMKLNATGSPGIEPSDTIIGVSNLVYGGTLSLTNINFNPLLSGSIYSFQLFSATNYSGAFNSLVPATPLSQPWLHLRWDTNELNVDGVLRVFPAVSPPPVISGTTIANGSLFINAGSGYSYDPCWLLTCTNLAAPVWSCIATNYFDVNGNITFTNTMSTGEPIRCFKLQVN